MPNEDFNAFVQFKQSTLVKVKLINEPNYLYGQIASTRGVQPSQLVFTPGNAASLLVIKSIAVFRQRPDDLTNYYELRLYSDDVESIEAVNVDDLNHIN